MQVTRYYDDVTQVLHTHESTEHFNLNLLSTCAVIALVNNDQMFDQIFKQSCLRTITLYNYDVILTTN